MAYSQGGLIAATDYNNFVGAYPSLGTGTINAVWATGSGSAGYGQTALTQAAASAGTITATQWATLNTTVSTLANYSVRKTVNLLDSKPATIRSRTG